MKKIIAAVLATITLISLVGCSSKDYKQLNKKFTKDGITLTLTKAFEENTVFSDGTAHATYVSNGATVVVLKDGSTSKSLSAKEYAERWISANAKYSPAPLTEEKTFVSTEYKAYQQDKAHIIYTAFYKSGESFWIVQFLCPEANYEEYSPYFAKWARKVKFENK